MRTPASIAHHPIHPMVVPVAIGGFVLSFIFDIVRLIGGNAEAWGPAAFYTMLGGIAGGVLAAFFGFADFWSLPPGHVRKMGVAHMVLNVTVIALFVLNAFLRYTHPESIGLPFALSFVAVLTLIASGWLGGAMVYEHGVGVRGAGAEESPGASGTRDARRAQRDSAMSS